MIELEGKYAKAKVFTDNVESAAIGQIIEMCNQPYSEGAHVRMMSDVHAGKGCTIGTTMLIKDKVCPNIVGVDIGCGMAVWKLQGIKGVKGELQKLDTVIREKVPSGMNVRESEHKNASLVDLEKLRCLKGINLDRAYKSIGSLGGGNHFIELNYDENDDSCVYLVVHSGSRYLGTQVAKYYQDMAYKNLSEDRESLEKEKKVVIEKLKAEGRERNINRD